MTVAAVRRIVHVDLDAFFAAVEQRDQAALRGLPVAVGGAGERGVVMAASYEARRFGVGSAMPTRMALKRCPELIVVPPRFEIYRQESRRIRAILRRWTDLVEPLALDEAYLDVTRPKRGPASGTLVAAAIKDAIADETGLTASAGVSYCKFLAKIASDLEKPDGLVTVTPDEAPALLETLPVERLFGVGPRTRERLHAMGVRTGGDLRRVPVARLEARFGVHGRRYAELARGIDPRPVNPNRVRKSVSSETTFASDRARVEELVPELPSLVADVVRRLEGVDASGRSVVVKLKDDRYRIRTRRLLLPLPARAAEPIEEAAEHILRERFELERPVRLLGVGVTALVCGRSSQPPLFPDPRPRPA